MRKEMKNSRKSIIYLHIAVMLFGLSGVVAQFVQVSSVMVAMGRVVSSSILLLCIILFQKGSLKLREKKDYILIMATGVVLAVHWTTFFQSIQVSSVAIGTITFSTFPLFLTFFEPLVFHEKLQKQGLICAILLLVGVFITIPEFSLENQMTVGILWGMACSVTYAVLTLANRYFSGRYDGKLVCFYEQGTAAIVLLPTLLFVEAEWRVQDILGVGFVGIICTAFAYTLYVSAQKKVKAQTAGLISGMETVYGIVYALIFLGEVPTAREIIGGIVILGVAIFSSVSKVETGQ